MAARGYLLEGDLYMAPFVGGVAQALQGPFEGTVFSIEPQSETVDMISRGRNSTGQILESVSSLQPTNFNITFAEADPQLLAMGLMGSVAAITQASGNFTNQTVVARLGKWVPLPFANIGAGALTIADSQATALVEGTHYELNRHMGMIRVFAAPAQAAVTEGETLTISAGAYGAQSGSRIQGGVAPDVRAMFILDGRNRVDGANMKLTVWEAIMSASEAMDFLAGGFLTTALTGRMKKPAGKASAFELDVLDA